VSAFGSRANPRFWPYLGLVNPIGESRREKARTEGETFRGRDTLFASFLGKRMLEVSVCGSRLGISPEIPFRPLPNSWTPLRKGERIRETRGGAIVGYSNCPFLAKGEDFRESFAGLAIVKVRKYRTKITWIARKSPTDAVRAIRVWRLLKSLGEVFRGPSSRTRKRQISLRTG
jgi:hypothetical protein